MPVAAPLIPRPRLLRALAGRWKVATLVAPAGWGKTTLATQLATRGDSLWVTLGPEQRTPARLLGAMLAAGARLSPPLGRSVLALFEGHRDFERDGGFLTARLLHEMAARARPLCVVLDDAHELVGARGVVSWAAALIEASPEHVRFVVAARGESPFSPGRFGGLGERAIDRAALAFEPAEAHRLLERLRAPRARRPALVTRYGGWAVGLVAGARATGDEESEWSTLASRELESLAPAVRRDLLLASALGELEPEALAAALSRPRARRLLDTVRRRGLYLDLAGTVPRFHPLFQDVLHDLAARELPPRERRAALTRAAAHWRRHGRPVHAIAALAAAGRGVEAVAAFERAWRDGGTSVRDALCPVAERWLLPDGPLEAAHSPAVLLGSARQDADGGRFELASARAIAAAEGWLAMGQPIAAARAYWDLSIVANQSVRFAPVIRYGTALLVRLRTMRGRARERSFAAALVRARVGSMRLYAGDSRGARTDLDVALAALGQQIHSPEYADTEVSRATLDFVCGRWELYLTRARRALAIYRRTGYWGRAHALLVNMAEGYIYLGEEATARAHLDEAASLATGSSSLARQALLEISRARAFSEEGIRSAAVRAFRSARRAVANASTPFYDSMLDTWEGVFERRRGRLVRAERLLARAEAGFALLESPSWRNVARLERALVTGLRGRSADALAALAECARVSRRLGDRKEEARVLLFAARVTQCAGRPHADALRTALRLLDRENYRVLLRKESDVATPLSAGSGPAPPAADRGPRARAAERTEPRRVRVQLLGGFRLEVNGLERPIARTAARQLVSLLVLRGGNPERREALAERLWPGAAPSASRNRFDVALTAARQALEPDAGPRGPFTVLRGEGGRLWLDPVTERDTEHFETLATQAEREGTLAGWQRAAAAYAGPLVPEWLDAEWAEDARERLQSRHARVLASAARAALASKEYPPAVRWAEEALEHDPLDETALALVMRAHVAAGSAHEAARVYRRFTARCRAELGAPPGPELVALARELGIPEPR